MTDKMVCGTCHPPADDTCDREIIDRFADFLRVAGRPRLRSPAERYHLGLLAWKIDWFPDEDSDG